DKLVTGVQTCALPILVDETGGRWRLTTKGRELDVRFRKELAAYFATLEPLPRNDLARLASLLGEALAAIERSDVPKDHLRRAARSEERRVGNECGSAR